MIFFYFHWDDVTEIFSPNLWSLYVLWRQKWTKASISISITVCKNAIKYEIFVNEDNFWREKAIFVTKIIGRKEKTHWYWKKPLWNVVLIPFHIFNFRNVSFLYSLLSEDNFSCFSAWNIENLYISIFGLIKVPQFCNVTCISFIQKIKLKKLRSYKI